MYLRLHISRQSEFTWLEDEKKGEKIKEKGTTVVCLCWNFLLSINQVVAPSSSSSRRCWSKPTTNNHHRFYRWIFDRKSAFRDSGSICRRIYIYRSDEGNEGGGTNYCVNGLTCELGPKLLIAPDYVLPYDRWSAAPGLYLLRFSIHWLSNCMVC